MNHEILSEQMDLAGMSQKQLIGLCNTLYELLQRPAPAFTFIPPQPFVQPYVSPTAPWPMWNDKVTCTINESTQQERFGVK